MECRARIRSTYKGIYRDEEFGSYLLYEFIIAAVLYDTAV